MRIGLGGGGSTPDKLVAQAKQAEAEGFASLWYASLVQGDPLAAMALAGRETSAIELGTAVLQTYPVHPVLQAQRIAGAVAVMGRAGLTIGLGPSHQRAIEGVYGLSYARPALNTEEYLRILMPLLRGEGIDAEGEEWSAHVPAGMVRPAHPVPVLLAALAPRMLRVAGELADGVILWIAPVKAVERHIVPRVRAAAEAAGRPAPRVVAGLPVCVHDDEQEARAAVAAGATVYANVPAYQRIMAVGGVDGPADAAIVGDEKSVEAQLRALLDAGATDIHAHIVPAGPDLRASLKRTRGLLASLAGS
ncbi:F420-dependent oxidoreductase, MSMEG_4879 family [Frankia sp. EI5c]|uniref:TIGR03564 family F420-dependent LLM class oxidoreductase n=1 Tax=Frankia sp. EI5c TaxID=683316 RepID=UPI0007C29059|nr:TIGR03564 family F420-dependent LLM class oxidoreductase [Frankia sp. EI5c]OAA27517.1 F420-dependent oxidoreductase, MSMEG_4879 family [Frankia sp. EI5c]